MRIDRILERLGLVSSDARQLAEERSSTPDELRRLLGSGLAAALIIGAGIFILMRPGLGVLLLVTWIGVYALFAGIGGFDYWAHYASGRPTRPEDHSGHGANSWRDYFRVNTDHKVIGIQYLVTTIVFFVIAGLLAMFMRAELAQPGMQFVDNQTFNGLFSVHAALMIFLFVIPAFAGIGNYVIPLMLGALHATPAKPPPFHGSVTPLRLITARVGSSKSCAVSKRARTTTRSRPVSSA